MNRKNFIFSILSITALISKETFAFPISKFLGQNPDPNFLKLYFDRLYKFHCSNFFDFEKHFNKPDKEFLKFWIEKNNSLGLKISENHFYENFLFSHQYTENKINSSKLILSLNTWDEESKKYLNKVLDAKKIYLLRSETLKIRGIGWDIENSLFYIFSKVNSNDDLLSKHKKVLDFKNLNYINPIQQVRIINLETKNETYEWHIPQKKITNESFPANIYLDTISCIKVIFESENKPEFIYRLRSLSNEAVDKPIHPIIKKMASEFNSHPDYIRYLDKSNFTINYP